MLYPWRSTQYNTPNANATDKRLEWFASISDPMRRTYCAMALALDEAVGRVLDKLRSSNLEQDTLIFFCSDNGGPTVPRAAINGSRNAPLRGSKVSTLEGGIHVPFVVSWRGKAAGRQGLRTAGDPARLPADGLGRSRRRHETRVEARRRRSTAASQRKAAGAPHDALYWRLGEQMAVRQGNWKLVRYSLEFADEEPRQGLSSVRLYDLSRDIGEATDLASAQPDKVQELKTLWDLWARTWPNRCGPPIERAGAKDEVA